MEWNTALKGLLLGISIAAPVGPMGVLCIRRTLAHGRGHGLATGFGAASADAVYAWAAGAGLSILTSFLIGWQVAIRCLGGAFLIYLGIKTFFSKPSADQGDQQAPTGLVQSGVSAFFLTLSNPATILMFLGVFAGISSEQTDILGVLSLVVGVFSGSMLWWGFLSQSISLLRRKFSAVGLTWVNRISGVCIGVFGIVAVIGAIL